MLCEQVDSSALMQTTKANAGESGLDVVNKAKQVQMGVIPMNASYRMSLQHELADQKSYIMLFMVARRQSPLPRRTPRWAICRTCCR